MSVQTGGFRFTFTGEVFQKEITFDQPITSNVSVVCNLQDTGPNSHNAFLSCSTGLVTETGFTATVKAIENTNPGQQVEMAFYWIAAGS